jgi:hypothetical protein
MDSYIHSDNSITRLRLVLEFNFESVKTNCAQKKTFTTLSLINCVFDGYLLAHQLITTDMSQGSRLGLVLFSIYITDMILK